MTNAWPHGNLEEDLDAWVDRELLAALKLHAQISRGPLKSVGEIVEEKIEAARNWRLGQQHPPIAKRQKKKKRKRKCKETEADGEAEEREGEAAESEEQQKAKKKKGRGGIGGGGGRKRKQKQGEKQKKVLNLPETPDSEKMLPQSSSSSSSS